MINHHIKQGKGQIVGTHSPESPGVLFKTFYHGIKLTAFFFLKSDQQVIHHHDTQIINRHLMQLFVELHHFEGDKETVVELFHLRTRSRFHHIRQYIGRNVEGICQLLHQLLIVQPVYIQPDELA